eukprot:TRINITY_DN464_c0_g1_i1.p1 TRINITY_DN464_c0_g1~~TRINITY_DN464_c0_g1_i1.p1  ORF type:complete len:473 (-),score=108.04 TRINITY_DN464_c0_g1_i1:100-1518(-)
MEDKAARAEKYKNISVASLTSPQKTGFLTKRGGRKTNWRKRFCVLHGGKLYYFKNQKAKQPKGAIELEQNSTVAENRELKKANCFQITTQKRVFYIFADTEQSKKTWIDGIQKTINDMKPKQPEPDTPSKPKETNSEKADDETKTAKTVASPTVDKPRDERPDSPGSNRPRDKLSRAKEMIPFLRKEESKVVEFWQIWSESFPPTDGLTAGMAIEFEVSTSLSMEKLKWRTCGPQNMFIQRMVDFFFDVGASESEIDRLNNVGALIEPSKIGSWIEMSDKQGMDGGWYFPVDMTIDKAIQAADAGEAIDKVKDWIQKHKIESCYSVGRDMGAMPPRQTAMKVNLPGPFAQQMEAALDAFKMFGFPPIPDDALNVLRGSSPSTISLSVITCSEGFVQIGIMTPGPDRETIAKLCEITKVSDRRSELETFERALGKEGPAFCEYQHLMKNFGYGVYKEGFDVILHYSVGEERAD